MDEGFLHSRSCFRQYNMIAILPGGKIRPLMNRKRWLLLFCFLILVAITLLASSLHDVHFQPGRSLPTGPISDNPVILQAPEVLTAVPLWKILLFWLAFVINLILFFYLLPPEVRKRVIRQVLGFSIGSLILLIALRYRILQLPGFTSEPLNLKGQLAPQADPNLITPVFHPPQVTPWVTYLISLSILLALLSLAWIAYRWWTTIPESQISLAECHRRYCTVFVGRSGVGP